MPTAYWRSSKASSRRPWRLVQVEGTVDLRSALAALRELRGTVELTAKLTPRADGGARRSK